MRLLNTSLLEFHEFEGKKELVFAILSHRWETEEVTFAAFQDPIKRQQLHGWSKIANFCRLASAEGYAWVWIDTCCIDKSSSAELTEAINSMYRWYKDAGICLAYLSDVEGTDMALPHVQRQFRVSRWFTRGWTLQELLAPLHVRFYNRDWQLLGNKDALRADIFAVTGIAAEGMLRPHAASVAQRMFWGSSRQTTRPEDLAYCLLGLFGVNMPLLYGEGGEEAFVRLQLEIIRKYDDESIFAWTGKWGVGGSGLLANSPRAFRGSREVVRNDFCVRSPFQMTNKGLQIDLPLKSTAIGQGAEWFQAELNCALAGHDPVPLVIMLATSRSQGHPVYHRVGSQAPQPRGALPHPFYSRDRAGPITVPQWDPLQ